jgi:signal transduction histidine kinase
MRLADFILGNVQPILMEWERFARSLSPGAEMDIEGLRDHAEAILRSAARDMVSPQTARQQSNKSKGLGGDGIESVVLDNASKEHAIDRLLSGFSLIEVVSEYRALRASVLRLWTESVPEADPNDLKDLTRFNEAIDQSLAEAVRSFTDRLEESRELFLATLGHDLRNPLNAVNVTAEVLARAGQLDEEHTRYAVQVGDYTKVMGRMIDDLLDFTRSRLGKGMAIVRQTMDLRSVCRDVMNQFQAAEPHRELRLTSSDDTTGEWDPERLRQVVSNLIANAIEHGAEDSPIDMSVMTEGDDVLLTVSNQGKPIPADVLPRLFDPLVRGASRSRSRDRHGSIGLGLYIVREIVMAHGGSISVTSSASAGTAFTVRLPK